MKSTRTHAHAVLEIIERARRTAARVAPPPSAGKQTDRTSDATHRQKRDRSNANGTPP